MVDPFADEAQSASVTNNDAFATTPEVSNTVTTAPVTTVAPSEDGKIVVTLKGGSGYDKPWIVIHASDASDALEQLQDDNLKALIERTAAVAQFFVGKAEGEKPKAAPQQAQQSSKPAQQQAPGGKTETCAHGEMTFRSGVSQKNGKPWKAFFCPAPKGEQQCDAVFIR